MQQAFSKMTGLNFCGDLFVNLVMVKVVQWGWRLEPVLVLIFQRMCSIIAWQDYSNFYFTAIVKLRLEVFFKKITTNG